MRLPVSLPKESRWNCFRRGRWRDFALKLNPPSVSRLTSSVAKVDYFGESTIPLRKISPCSTPSRGTITALKNCSGEYLLPIMHRCRHIRPPGTPASVCKLCLKACTRLPMLAMMRFSTKRAISWRNAVCGNAFSIKWPISWRKLKPASGWVLA